MIELQAVCKRYPRRSGEVRALDAIDLSVPAGEYLCLKGPSGSGKTTLLMLAGGMLHPSAGEVRVAGEALYSLDNRARAAFRAARLGFVFQMFHLVPYLDVLDNVLLAGNGNRSRARRSAALELLERVDLRERAAHLPGELSAGERQRAALARALLNEPALILADEPTGNLDEENAARVLDQLAAYHRAGGTVVLVTHGSQAEPYADRVLHMRAGQIAQ